MEGSEAASTHGPKRNRYAQQEAVAAAEKKTEQDVEAELDREMRTLPDLLRSFRVSVVRERERLDAQAKALQAHLPELSGEIECLLNRLGSDNVRQVERDRVNNILHALNMKMQRIVDKCEQLEDNMRGFVSQSILYHMRHGLQATPFPTDNAVDCNVPGLLIDNPTLPPTEPRLPALGLTALAMPLFVSSATTVQDKD